MRRSLLVALFYISGLPGALAQGIATYDVAGGDFEQKVIADSAKQPVVVMFRDNSCAPAPCNSMTIEAPQMAFAAFAGKVKFYTVDSDVERALAAKYQVTAAPRIIVFKNGAAAASRDGEASANALFAFFTAKASPEARQADQKPPEALEAKRPPGAGLKTIGGWEIDRDGNGVAYALRAFKYLRKLDETKAGPWTVTGSAALSLRYDPQKEETIWDVAYSQDITRIARPDEDRFLQANRDKVIKEHPGSIVRMMWDGEQVAALPDPLMLEALETAKRVDARQYVDPNGARGYLDKDGARRRWSFHSVVANKYLERFGYGTMRPAEFERLFINAKAVQFKIAVDKETVILSEIALEDTEKALAYLKGEVTYAWRKQHPLTAPR
jgi:thioredoxin 1